MFLCFMYFIYPSSYLRVIYYLHNDLPVLSEVLLGSNLNGDFCNRKFALLENRSVSVIVKKEENQDHGSCMDHYNFSQLIYMFE